MPRTPFTCNSHVEPYNAPQPQQDPSQYLETPHLHNMPMQLEWAFESRLPEALAVNRMPMIVNELELGDVEVIRDQMDLIMASICQQMEAFTEFLSRNPQ